MVRKQDRVVKYSDEIKLTMKIMNLGFKKPYLNFFTLRRIHDPTTLTLIPLFYEN
jgi:hypothetical protein